jgi:hypothetical protein
MGWMNFVQNWVKRRAVVNSVTNFGFHRIQRIAVLAQKAGSLVSEWVREWMNEWLSQSVNFYNNRAVSLLFINSQIISLQNHLILSSYLAWGFHIVSFFKVFQQIFSWTEQLETHQHTTILTVTRISSQTCRCPLTWKERQRNITLTVKSTVAFMHYGNTTNCCNTSRLIWAIIWSKIRGR